MGRLTKRKSDGTVWGMTNVSTMSYGEITAVFEKLAHYEDLKEQGRLIKLPCAVGDTAYFITVNAEGEYIIGSGKFSYSWLDYPRMIYATKEEAEAKLAELKGE